MENDDLEYKLTIKISYSQRKVKYFSKGSLDLLEKYSKTLTKKERRLHMQVIKESTETLKNIIGLKQDKVENKEKIDWKSRALKAEARIKELELRVDRLEKMVVALLAENAELRARIVYLEGILDKAGIAY